MRSNNLLDKIMLNAGLIQADTIANNKALMQMAEELKKKGVTTSRDGDYAYMKHHNFFLGGKADSIGWLCALKKDFIVNLVNLKNVNDCVFAIDADTGIVDIGFNLERFGITGEQAVNMRFQTNIDWLRAALINYEGNGAWLRLKWMESITQEEYSQINDENSLEDIAFAVLERKIEEINKNEHKDN